MFATGVVRKQCVVLSVTAAAWLLSSACNVYEPELGHAPLLDASTESISDGATWAPEIKGPTSAVSDTDAGPRPESGAARQASQAVQAEGAAAPAATRPVAPEGSKSCGSGECWWSLGEHECRSAGRPGAQDRPGSSSDDGKSIPAVYFGWTQVGLGEEAGSPQTDSPQQWQGFGLDLDGVCTNSATCPGKKDIQSCRAANSQIPFDGSLCRDNRFARLQATLAPVPEIGQRFGLSESKLNCNLRRGSYNMVVKLSDYNGQPDDPSVRVDFYKSPGLERLPPWSCDDDKPESYPIWSTAATWQIDETDLTSRPSARGDLPGSKVADAHAYVRAGYLVAELPDAARLRLAGSSNTQRGFALTTRKAVWTGALQQMQDGTWQISDGLVAGITLASDLLGTFQELGLCQQTDKTGQPDGSGFYQLVSDAIRENADMLADGRVEASAPCDALSFGISFLAAQVTPGGAVPAPERLVCCPPPMTAEDCHPECGDGVVSGDEQCDTAITSGQGACPRSCSEIDSCTPRRLTGSGCQAHCEPAPIIDAIDDDRCCPRGENASTDSDCSSHCGNGVREPGETCEQNDGSCLPRCESQDKCMVGTLTGTPMECNVSCSWSRIDQCRNGDGCCPSGCVQSRDSDCSPSCGNGVLEGSERCENNSSKPCPTSCEDNDACTEDKLSGSASTCDAACDHKRITATVAGDHCCPNGANATTDSDCATVCGNYVRELAEECDDGNTKDGDGCSSACKNELTTQPTAPRTTSDGEAACLARLGNSTDSCSSCICTSCQQQVNDCSNNPNATEAKECRDAWGCALNNRCYGLGCYCTNSQGCTAGTPDGPCRSEFEAAAHTKVPSEVASRLNDSAYPLGRVMRATGCIVSGCGSTCTVQQPQQP